MASGTTNPLRPWLGRSWDNRNQKGDEMRGPNEFAIEVSGKIDNVYEITANSLEEAERKAIAEFKEDYPEVTPETIEAVEI